MVEIIAIEDEEVGSGRPVTISFILIEYDIVLQFYIFLFDACNW